MHDVSAVVNTESDSDDEVDAGYSVDGQAPEVDEASDIDECQQDADKNKNAGGEVPDQD